ncbi:MAG TPA: hypothetical protein VG713_05185 [Pirellulales bacterium]|nr:hypothetical protein [Pirellulales bacterium]
MSTVFFIVDDKYVPLYRVMWIAATPHYCGEEDCEREGYYEVRLEQGESVWAKADERDALITAVEQWANGDPPDDEEEGDGQWN